MSIPQGAVWQEIRERALDTVPPGSKVAFRSPLTLRQWESRGAYTVTSAQPKKVELVVFTEEFGGVLLTEAEMYLDHAAEHQVSLWGQLRASQWHSTAWQQVTIYYWAYYLAVALTRLLGRSVWYIDDSVASHLTTLAATGTRVGAGTFTVVCGATISLSDREVSLKKGSGRLHEQLWRLFFAALEGFVKSSRPTAGSVEERLYATVLESSRLLGADWPSALRNLLNYRPGFGYGAVRHVTPIVSIKRHDPPFAFDELLSQFENDVASFDRTAGLEIQVAAVSRALVAFTFILSAIVRELYKDILDRSSVDKRWDRNRDQFLSTHGVKSSQGFWPC